MKKIILISLLIALCFVLASCSSGVYSPIKREHESKNDVIKFYNFDWMIGIDDVKQELIKEHGLNTFTINYSDYFTKYSDYAGAYSIGIHGTNEDKQLLWELADQKIDFMIFKFVSDPSIEANKVSYDDKMYLFGGSYYFVENTEDTAKALKSKLNSIYGYGEQGDYSAADINYVWKDTNGNTIELYYRGAKHYKLGDTWYDDDPTLHLNYTCGDIQNYLDEERAKYKEEEKKNNANDDKL